MAKVCIIDVDLGIDINKILESGVEELTAPAKEALEVAIADQKALNKLKEAKETEIQQKQDKLDTIMIAAYNMIKESNENGVPVSTILDNVIPTVANASAFTMRMKTLLQKEGNIYILERIKRHGTPHYVFKPFNQESNESSVS